jgi:nucleotide-binding universal stress UspA family protein
MKIDIKKICVPTDFSSEAEHALLYAATLARRFEAELHLIHVVQDMTPGYLEGDAMMGFSGVDLLETIEKDAKRRLESVQPPDWPPAATIVRYTSTGVPYDEICKYAKKENIDLVVIGTHGRTGLKHFLLGSVAERVVRTCPCPVLAVHRGERDFVAT